MAKITKALKDEKKQALEHGTPISDCLNQIIIISFDAVL